MKQELAETLDSALARRAAGDTLPAVLDTFADETGTLAGLLATAERLALLEEVTLPDPAAQAADRAVFLAEVEARQAVAVTPQRAGAMAAVSFPALLRLKEWIVDQMASLPGGAGARQKERTMIPYLLKAAFVLVLAFGSVGGTVAVSADSLPGSAGYPVKLAVEQARLALSGDPAGDATLHLAYAQERVREMEQLAGEGTVPDQAAINRLVLHLNQVLHFSAQQPEEQMFTLLTQAQQVIRTQNAVMARLGQGRVEPAQLQAQAELGALQRLGWEIEEGLRDPATLRHRYGISRPDSAPAQPEMVPGAGPPITHTYPVTSPNGYGAGAGPGAPGGNPDCVPAGDCEPAGSQYQHQQHGDQPAPGENSGNGDCLQNGGEGCVPAGDQHQYGQDATQPGPGAAPNDDPGGHNSHNGEINGHQGGTGAGDNGGAATSGGGKG